MRNCQIIFLGLATLLFFVSGCCKDKQSCKGEVFQVNPFVERYSKFECQNNNEYTYIFKSSSEIENLKPTCFFTSPIAFPINETNMRYFLVGRLSYHQKDTFQTLLLKDTCSKTLVYDVNMIQRDTAYYFPDRRGGILDIYCAVEDVPADYKVEVKYKYVPLP